MREMTDHFWQVLKNKLGDRVHLNGYPDERLPNTLNVSFVGWNGHEVLAKLPQIAASTGSACDSVKTSLSPVLEAMNVSEDVGRGAIRFSLGRFTTKAEVDLAADQIIRLMNS